MIAFKKLRPLLNRVLVQKPVPIAKTKGGILLPENK
jgi:co-chaperonin GroES (HSP10)